MVFTPKLELDCVVVPHVQRIFEIAEPLAPIALKVVMLSKSNPTSVTEAVGVITESSTVPVAELPWRMRKVIVFGVCVVAIP